MLDPQKDNPFIDLKARHLVLAFFVINFAVGFISGLILSVANFSIKDPIMTYIFYILSFGLLCFWILQRFRKLQIKPKQIIGTLPSNYQWLTLIGITVAILLFSIGAALLSFYLLSLVAPSFFESLIKSLATDHSKFSSVPTLFNLLKIISLVIVAPITEEFIFRGILLQRWSVKWGTTPAILASSLLFGCLHVNPVGLTVFGIVMALLYIKTHTLIVPMVAHALNNTVVVAMVLLSTDSSLSKTTTAYSNWQSGVVLIALSAPFLIRFIYKKWPNPRVALPYFANTCE